MLQSASCRQLGHKDRKEHRNQLCHGGASILFGRSKVFAGRAANAFWFRNAPVDAGIRRGWQIFAGSGVAWNFVLGTKKPIIVRPAMQPHQLLNVTIDENYFQILE